MTRAMRATLRRKSVSTTAASGVSATTVKVSPEVKARASSRDSWVRSWSTTASGMCSTSKDTA
jgi:hypothetical protein